MNIKRASIIEIHHFVTILKLQHILAHLTGIFPFLRHIIGRIALRIRKVHTVQLGKQSPLRTVLRPVYHNIETAVHQTFRSFGIHGNFPNPQGSGGKVTIQFSFHVLELFYQDPFILF